MVERVAEWCLDGLMNDGRGCRFDGQLVFPVKRNWKGEKEKLFEAYCRTRIMHS